MVKMNVTTDDGDVMIRGTLLAQATSRQFRHRHPQGERHAPPKHRCSACRWTRVTLLRTDEEYVVITEGFSLVPGERTLGKVERTTSPLWVIQYLHRKSKDKDKYLPLVARNALMMAVEYDEKLARECEHRGIEV